MPAVVVVVENQLESKSGKDQVVKIARFVCVYGILPIIMTIGNISISSKTGYKPHGSSGSFLIIYGIIIPLSFILNNQKLKAFAKEFVHRNSYGLICWTGVSQPVCRKKKILFIDFLTNTQICKSSACFLNVKL